METPHCTCTRSTHLVCVNLVMLLGTRLGYHLQHVRVCNEHYCCCQVDFACQQAERYCTTNEHYCTTNEHYCTTDELLKSTTICCFCKNKQRASSSATTRLTLLANKLNIRDLHAECWHEGTALSSRGRHESQVLSTRSVCRLPPGVRKRSVCFVPTYWEHQFECPDTPQPTFWISFERERLLY
jgi:hypothetical protein